MLGDTASVSLASRWFVRPGCEAEALAATAALAERVYAEEPDTLTYLVHTPQPVSTQQSLPPAEPGLLLFFETYRDPQAFLRHVNGPAFAAFVREHGKLFVSAHGAPYTTVEFLARRAGFVRSALPPAQLKVTGAEPHAHAAPSANQHPAVMFEIIAKDQKRALKFYTDVFGWNYQTGTGGFAYVHFPVHGQPLLGGIGQTQPGVPGFEPGHNFYLLVDDLERTVRTAVAAGGKRFVEPVEVDGYHFAMIHDPEGNPIGLLQPFNG